MTSITFCISRPKTSKWRLYYEYGEAVLKNFNVNTRYLEDRDNAKGAGALPREYITMLLC
ncbi:hypothetical protein HNP68_000413 [Borrelia yangtzensis]|uniref:Uncharacterized protein n=1 Tax=Borreliella yangtzensis TaxID=683292 RepID=A0ABR6P987_9SPIR|nr:hypothetical protein [Borreliella yangtzensis]